MFPTQSNTTPGQSPFPSAVDLTGKEALLVKLTVNGGVAQIALPAALTDIPLFVVGDGYPVGKASTVLPLTIDENRRVRLKGTCNPGDVLSLADPAVPADAGKLRKLPAVTGTYRAVAVAEEVGVDGQLLLVRPAAIGLIVVP